MKKIFQEVTKEIAAGSYKMPILGLLIITLILIITLSYLVISPRRVYKSASVPTTSSPAATPTASPTATLVPTRYKQSLVTPKVNGASITVKVMDHVTGQPITSDDYTVSIKSEDGSFSTIYSRPGIHTTYGLKAGTYIVIATSPDDYYDITGGCTSKGMCSGDIGRMTLMKECARKIVVGENEAVESLCRFTKLGTQ